MSVVLKRGYAPHEQYHSRGNQGPWTDVHACAATMYHALTGYKPPEAASRMLEDDLVPPDELSPSLSEATTRAIIKGLEILPENRPQSVGALREMLPDLTDDANPGWVGEPTTTDLPSADKGTELQLWATHECRLYIDGSEVGELSPEEEYVIGAEPGSHRLRAVRLDQETENPATVTAANGTGGADHEAFVSLDELIWKDIVTTSSEEMSSIEIDFDEVQSMEETEVAPDPTMEKESGSPSTAEVLEATSPPDTASTPAPNDDQNTADVIAGVDADTGAPDESPDSIKAKDDEGALDELIHQLADQISEFIATAVVDMDTGAGVASHSVNSDFDVTVVNEAYTDFVQSNREALDLLGADPLDTTDILISTNGIYLIARELSADYYMGLAISQDANLALARQMMASYEPQLREHLPE